MKNAAELRAALSQVFKDLQAGTIKAKEAGELANLAGKMINSAKVQVEYHALLGDRPHIAFLHSKDVPE